MTIRRSITIICDRCSLESPVFVWPHTVREIMDRLPGWQRVCAKATPKGGAKRFHFCPDSICQSAALEVPRRMAEIRRAEAQIVKQEKKIAKLKGKR